MAVYDNPNTPGAQPATASAASSPTGHPPTGPGPDAPHPGRDTPRPGVSPLPHAALPVAPALVAGVILRIAVIGLQLVAREKEKGQLAGRHVATAAGTALTMCALLLSTH